MNLTFFSDNGHGWLEVPKTLIKSLGVKVTTFSYQNGDNGYLEEDSDAPRFMRAAEAAGHVIIIREENTDGLSPIRNYRRYS
jgi:hypothetical protein